MPNTDRDSMLERWANGAETLAQYYEDLYGPPPDPPSLPALTTYDGLLEAIVEATLRAKRNINKISPTYHNTDSAYVKTVPSGDVHYASLEQIGGKTLVFNQLVDSGTTTVATISGHKYYTLIDGTASIVTSSGSAITIVDDTADMVTDLTLCYGSGNEPTTVAEFTAQFPAQYYQYTQGTLLSAGVTEVVSRKNINDKALERNSSSTITTSNLPIVPSNTYVLSVDDSDIDVLVYRVYYYKQDGSYLSYNTVNKKNVTVTAPSNAYYIAIHIKKVGGTAIYSDEAALINAKVLSLINTYPIPASIQALEGYGWSSGSVYNYIDFERKVFVQRVGSVDMSDLTFGYGPSVGWSATLPNVKNPADDDTAFNGLSATLQVTDRNTQATAFSGGTDAGMVSVAGGKVYVGTGDIGIVPSGTLYYELATPIEPDISAYLTDDNLISVESGGTLTFPNSNGDDYRIPVPSSETFIVGEP